MTVLCDYGSRYRSRLFNPIFLAEKALPVPDWLTPEGQREIPRAFEEVWGTPMSREIMVWSKLLCPKRSTQPDYVEKPNRPFYMQDLDRIVFSAPFRRLANKTQVHPLYENDHIHHRLIHSVETGSVGRSLGMAIGHWLEVQGHCADGDKHRVSGIVQAACLAHDIGNPPFGHSGEDAIGDWFTTKFDNASGIFSEVDESLRGEFQSFEGNAQGLRILTRLEMYRNSGGMRLANSVLGSFTKYPVTERVQSNVESSYCGLKKFGIFASDQEIFDSVARAVGLPLEKSSHGNWWRRHPLVFLVEAADDICYGVLDIEDAFAAGDLSFEEASRCLSPLAGTTNRDPEGQTEQEQIAHMRATGIGAAIEACVDAFIQNYDTIMTGEFSRSLAEASEKKEVFKQIKDVASERIFTTRRKTELEVSGRNLIHQVLDGILPVYETLLEKKWNSSEIHGYEQKLVRALGLELRDIRNSYDALHSMADFVSGMTDRFTLRVARMISGRPALPYPA